MINGPLIQLREWLTTQKPTTAIKQKALATLIEHYADFATLAKAYTNLDNEDQGIRELAESFFDEVQ